MRHHPVRIGVLVHLFVLFLILNGCDDKGLPPTSIPNGTNDETADFPIPPEILSDIQALQNEANAPDAGLEKSSFGKKTVYLLAGSVDKLADAIASAGHNGVVVLRAGVHTENHLVAITRSVSIIGEHRAVLQLNTLPVTTPTPWAIQVGLHINGAARVKIWNLDIRPVSPVGGTAIVIENSPYATIGCNKFTNFQWSVLLHQSDHSTIWHNWISAATGWSDGSIPESEGVISITGEGVRVIDNEIEGGFFGAFMSGRRGYFLHNRVHDNYVGLILCKVPAGTYQFPGGNLVGAVESATGWFTSGNTATENINDGYLLIDGATKNIVVNNAADENGEYGDGGYDIELAGDSERYGFFTPRSFKNIVIAGSHKKVRIKDCGDDNVVIGGIKVDTSLEACN